MLTLTELKPWFHYNWCLFSQFKLMLSHDGSGKGAALVAAVADRLKQEKKQKDQKAQSITTDNCANSDDSCQEPTESQR